MEAYTLELTLLSCRDLKAFNFFQKLSPYVAVSIVSGPDSSGGSRSQECHQRQKTPVDRAGNRNPEWNHTLSFSLRPHEKSSSADQKSPAGDTHVRFEIRCEGPVFGNRAIGEVRVPLADLVDEFSGAARFQSYQVRTSSQGRPNGVLNFSYRVNGRSMKTKVGDQDPKFEPTEEAIQRKPKDISYPSIEAEDVQPLSPAPSRRKPPPGYVLYVRNNGQDTCTCGPNAPAPPRQGKYPASKMEVTGYGYYYLQGHNTTSSGSDSRNPTRTGPGSPGPHDTNISALGQVQTDVEQQD